MKRLLVFLVLVGLAVPGLADSTDVSHDVEWWADTLRKLFRGVSDVDTVLVSEVVAEYWDKHLSRYKFAVPASLVVLGSTAQSLFDSVYVFPPKKCPGGGMMLRLKGFYAEPKHPSIRGWPQIYCIYADTIIVKED